MKKIIAIISVLAMIFVMTACGGTDYSGTYVAESISADGFEMDLASMGIDGEDFMTIELHSDGKADITLEGEKYDNSEVTWEVSGKNITIDDGIDPISGTIEDDTMVIGQDGTEIVLVRK